MKDLKELSDRDLLLLTADRVQRLSEEFKEYKKEHKEEHKLLKEEEERNKKFRYGLVGTFILSIFGLAK